jgi:hypothetical protein
MTTMTKQTAGNNKLLAYTKRMFNGRIFKWASFLVNDESEAAAISYLLKFYNEASKPAAQASLEAAARGEGN